MTANPGGVTESSDSATHSFCPLDSLFRVDPADVYGDDFPGETFRVLKEKETRLYGEYRTQRLVLEAWGKGI